MGEDARRNRIYLPLHELAEYGVTTDDITQGRETDNFRRLMEFQIARARGLYDQRARQAARRRTARRSGRGS